MVQNILFEVQRRLNQVSVRNLSPKRVGEVIILPFVTPFGHAAVCVLGVCMYGDVHVWIVVKLVSFLNSVFESENDGIKLCSLACWYWTHPSWQVPREGFAPARFPHHVARAGTKGSWKAVASTATVNVHDHFVAHLVADAVKIL